MNETQAQIEYHSAFQKILIHFATTFINLPIDQMDDAITDALRQLVEFLGAMRSSINQFSPDLTRYHELYQFEVPSTMSSSSADGVVPNDDIVRFSLAHHQAITIANVDELPESSELAGVLRSLGIVAIAIMPLLDHNQWFGFISTSWSEPHPLDSTIVDLLRVIGEIFLNAMNRKRDEQAIRQFNTALEARVAERTAELVQVNRQLQQEIEQRQQAEYQQSNLSQALLDSAVALTSVLQLEELVKHILRSVYQVVPHDVANVMIVEGEDALVLGSRDYVAGTMDYTLTETRFKYKDHYYGNLMAQTRQPVILEDLSHDTRFLRIAEGVDLHGYLGTPIVVGQELIGFLSLGSQQVDFFTEAHAQYLQIFAIAAGIAIQNARLFAQAKTIAALEERQRIARELHDSVTQTLFSANMLAEAMPRVIAQEPGKADQYLRDLHQFTRGAMAEMRSLLVELRPEALTRTELGVLLSQLCDVFTGRTQIEVERSINRQIILPQEIQIVFYRVAQEALNNAAKYAQAAHVELTLYSGGGGVELRIRDDGQGFDPNCVAENHFGLKIMKERAADIGAEFTVISQIGDGTEIILKRHWS